MIKHLSVHTLPVLLCLLTAAAPLSRSEEIDILEQKSELEEIKKDIEHSRQQIDSLKNAEQRLLKEISDHEQRATMNQTVLNRLNDQLSKLRHDIDKSGDQLDDSKNQYRQAQNRYIGNLKYYYSGADNRRDQSGSTVTGKQDAFTRLVYLRALASYDKRDYSQTKVYLQAANDKYDDLVDREKSVGQVRDQKKNEYTLASTKKEKREKDLKSLRRKKENEADRLITLSAAARQMEELIARLESARQARGEHSSEADFDYATGNFAGYKGSLVAPMSATITKSFGWKTDRITKLKSYSPGIDLKGRKNSTVKAVAPGVVAYIGTMRGYGNFVIIEHEDGYYSTYAGLDDLFVELDQLIAKEQKMGITQTGLLKFELRQGKTALDPVEWIRLDSFK